MSALDALSPADQKAVDALRSAGITGLSLDDLCRALGVTRASSGVAAFVARARRRGYEIVATFAGVSDRVHVYRYTLGQDVFEPSQGALARAFGIRPQAWRLPGGAVVSLSRVGGFASEVAG